MKYVILFASVFFSRPAFAQSAPTPDANIIFKETFSDNTNNWPINTTGPAIYMIDNGAYVIENTDNKNCLVAIAVNNSMSDFVVSVNMEHVSGLQNVGYGLFFGGSDSKNGYVFDISAEGFFIFYRLTNNVYEEIIPWTENTAIVKGDSHLNVIKIKVSGKGKDMEFYINNTYAKSIKNYTLPGNKFGFIKSKNQRVRFDDLELQKKDADIELPDNFFDSAYINWDDIWGSMESSNKDKLKVFDSTDFSGKVYDWNFDAAHTKISNGKMITTSEKGKRFDASKNIKPKVSLDYAVAVDTKHIAGVQNSAYGVIIGDKYPKNNISFYITSNGYFNVLHGETYISNWTKNENIHIGENAENHLEIYKSDVAYSFYANGQLLYTYTFNGGFNTGDLKVLLEVNEAQTIEFDNLQIRGTPAAAKNIYYVVN